MSASERNTDWQLHIQEQIDRVGFEGAGTGLSSCFVAGFGGSLWSRLFSEVRPGGVESGHQRDGGFSEGYFEQARCNSGRRRRWRLAAPAAGDFLPHPGGDGTRNARKRLAYDLQIGAADGFEV